MTQSAPEQPTSFQQFWPIYVRAHVSKVNRTMHVIGTSLALACVVAALVKRRPWLALLAPVAGYGFGWAGHLVEGSRPTSFAHPIYSVRANLLLWWKTVSGEMDDEVRRILALDAEQTDRSEPKPAATDTATPQPASNLN